MAKRMINNKPVIFVSIDIKSYQVKFLCRSTIVRYFSIANDKGSDDCQVGRSCTHRYEILSKGVRSFDIFPLQKTKAVLNDELAIFAAIDVKSYQAMFLCRRSIVRYLSFVHANRLRFSPVSSSFARCTMRGESQKLNQAILSRIWVAL